MSKEIPQGAKLYDLVNDTFITDRQAIIDRLVAQAAQALTYLERGEACREAVPPVCDRLLRAALNNAGRERRGVYGMTKTLWRSDVFV